MKPAAHRRHCKAHMSHIFVKCSLLLAAAVVCSVTVHAQFGNVLQKAKDKAAQKAQDAIDKKMSSSSSSTGTSSTSTDNTTASTGDTNSGSQLRKRLNVESVFDFVPGDTVLYASGFEKQPAGALPSDWKTNGSGQLVKISDFPGAWLQVQVNSTYKLKQNLYLPSHCSIEFDILNSVDKIKDINPVQFGVAENNSVAGWNEGDISNVQLEYYNKDEVVTFAGPTDKYNSLKFDLEPYANDKMHVSIEINGNNMKVYLEKQKILDAQVFRDGVKKYFYFSSPLHLDNDAKVFFGNVRIAKYK